MCVSAAQCTRSRRSLNSKKKEKKGGLLFSSRVGAVCTDPYPIPYTPPHTIPVQLSRAVSVCVRVCVCASPGLIWVMGGVVHPPVVVRPHTTALVVVVYALVDCLLLFLLFCFSTKPWTELGPGCTIAYVRVRVRVRVRGGFTPLRRSTPPLHSLPSHPCARPRVSRTCSRTHAPTRTHTRAPRATTSNIEHELIDWQPTLSSTRRHHHHHHQ